MLYFDCVVLNLVWIYTEQLYFELQIVDNGQPLDGHLDLAGLQLPTRERQNPYLGNKTNLLSQSRLLFGLLFDQT